MDSEAYDMIKRIFDHIDVGVPREEDKQSEYARDVFEYMSRDGGEIEAIGEPRYQRTPAGQLGTWSEDPWTEGTYGIDSSTTRPIEFNNGLVVDTAYAKMGVAGDGKKTLERDGTVQTTVYFKDSDSTLYPTDFEDGNVTGGVVRFPHTGQTKNISQSVAAVAQKLSESQHAVDHIEDVGSVLFLDGSVYPMKILYWLIADEQGSTTPATTWDVPREIVSNYLQVIDSQYDKGLPVVGVVKTSNTSRLLDSLESKTDDLEDTPELPWMRDHQFIGEVLRDGSLEHISYTSWFVQKEASGSELLGMFENELEHGSAEDYRMAFFYVRLPKEGHVMRIEAPYLMVEDEERRRQVQYKTLKEIAQKKDVPRAVARADKIASISRENRQTIRDLITSTEYSYDYNWDGRWSELDTMEEE